MRTVRSAVIGGIALLIAGGTADQIHRTYAASPAATKQILVKGASGKYLFSPKSVTVKAGTRVIWKNTTDADHTITGSQGKAGFTSVSKALPIGKTVSYLFKKAGTYKYYCAIHPFMKGTIIVK